MSTVLIVGATQGTGRALAAEYARRGADVVITGRTQERAAEVAEELAGESGGTVRGLALDLSRPAEIAAALESVRTVDRVVLVGMVRDMNTTRAYDVVTATTLATTKIVGYTTVVASLRERMSADASVLLFGGMAKDIPYPGSTTLTAVNAAVQGLVRTLSVELAPVRVNSLHPWAIVDSPVVVDNEQLQDMAQKMTLTGRLATMADIVDGCLFLLENPIANGIDLTLNGGIA
ncbi:SDR family NAD(P)-dependent oxidoreductase [Streptomyces sp. MI02-7b]|uniref:SDR family NAD(P)-dependent oxidoreductase n=1 Tax=Streptomyces sp. MI02-7b TaxID=462941 RepID=UPI0029AF4428|nr:SDR family oxidoreductase [Streptomyces sp. MI02-7b]MDX3077670.1 SDR family oxidoreductase [Streptomyces sp. MI02-7b]